jgi:hypothetical protein
LALNTSGAKVENMAKVENKAKVEYKAKVENKAKMEKKTPAKQTTIKVQRDGMPIHRCDVKVKVEENNKVKVESLFPGAKANLVDLPTGTEQLKLGKHQMAKHLFNSEVNLVYDWLLEHRPKNLATKDTRAEKNVLSHLSFKKTHNLNWQDVLCKFRTMYLLLRVALRFNHYVVLNSLTCLIIASWR